MSGLSIYAPGKLDVMDSYGKIACELARHLTRLGATVSLIPAGDRITPGMDDELVEIASQPIKPALGAIHLGYPTNYHLYFSPPLCRGPRVAVTMFESSRIPPGWVEPLNAMDAVIVPSTFCRDVFVECGVTVPVHVVPLGVSEVYAYQARSTGRPLTFLAFMDRGRRKGGQVAEQAFLRAFGDDTRYQFVVKTRKPRQAFSYTNVNMRTVQRDMDEQELYELYLSADVLINPHKGEGFGLLPREAASTGCIALTTDWSGTADHLDQWGYALPYTLERADWSGNKTLRGSPELLAQDLGEWAATDAQAVADRLLHVAQHIDDYRAQAQSKAANVRRLYSWPAFAARVLDIWREVSRDHTDAKSKIAA